MTIVKKYLQKDNFLWWFVFAALILLVTSKNSPFFHTNDWVDANAFFTVGKGMTHGMVPYKDLFEQKGPYLYFLYALAAWFNPQKFIGVYLLEIIALTVDLVYCFRIFKLYFSQKTSTMLTAFFPMLIMNQYFFRQGGSAEEFCIPFLLIFLYHNLSVIKKNQHFCFSNGQYLWQGFSVAYLFLLKFTLLGPWIAFYLFIFAYQLYRKNWREIGKMIGFSLIGFLIGTIPWLLYFLVNDALNDFLEAYLFVNSSAYNEGSFSLLERLFFILQMAAHNFKENATNFFILLPGLIVIPLLKPLSPRKNERLVILLYALSCLFFIYVGLRGYKYYFLFFMPFGIFGLIFFAAVLEELHTAVLGVLDLKWKQMLPFVFIVAYLAAVSCNSNIIESDLFPYNKTIQVKPDGPTQTAQQRFAKYMHQKKAQPTLLNYDSLDGGFYLAADLLPAHKDFQLLNIDPKVYPDNYEHQRTLVKEGAIDFVVVEKKHPLSEKNQKDMALDRHYRLVKKHQQMRDGKKRYYYLFENKKLSSSSGSS